MVLAKKYQYNFEKLANKLTCIDLPVVPSPKSPSGGYDFDYHIAHALSCALKKDVECTRKYGRLRFGSLHEMIKDVQEECLEQGRRCTRRALVHALNEEIRRKGGALNEAQHTKLLVNDQTTVLV